jgi:predicted Rossmann fold flavoprotein
MDAQTEQYDVIVVGGGASGMYAALHAAKTGARVLLLEKNARLGEKLRITGGGRCNITNAEFDNRLLLKNYGKAEQFLYSLFVQHSVSDTIAFFEQYGLPIVVEARKRAFPASHNAEDVVAVLEQQLKNLGVDVKTHAPVQKIVFHDGAISSLLTKNTSYRAKSYIFSTGSLSHPETGSTGDGFNWLRQSGHTVVEPTPDIVPLACSAEWLKDMSGVALKDCKITFYCDKLKQFSLKGDVLCTHFGVSGPLILNNSRRVSDLLQNGQVTAEVDLLPQVDSGTLQRQILAVFDQHKNKSLRNVLSLIAPEGARKALQTLLLNEEIDIEVKVHSVSKETRVTIARVLKTMPLQVTGLMGFEKAVIADGGVDIREIDFKSMRSKQIQNLYVTGDLLHINRPSGGYSLQLCWSSGYAAGVHAANN